MPLLGIQFNFKTSGSTKFGSPSRVGPHQKYEPQRPDLGPTSRWESTNLCQIYESTLNLRLDRQIYGSIVDDTLDSYENHSVYTNGRPALVMKTSLS